MSWPDMPQKTILGLVLIPNVWTTGGIESPGNFGPPGERVTWKILDHRGDKSPRKFGPLEERVTLKSLAKMMGEANFF